MIESKSPSSGWARILGMELASLSELEVGAYLYNCILLDVCMPGI